MGSDKDWHAQHMDALPVQMENIETAPLGADGVLTPPSYPSHPSHPSHPSRPQVTAPFDELAQFAALHAPRDGATATPLTVILPPRPTTVAETGLELVLLEELALKHIVNAGVITGAELAERMCLTLPGVVEEAIAVLRRDGLVDYHNVSGGALHGNAGMRLRATDRGVQIETRAREHNGYVGPAPVKFSAYAHMLRQQAMSGRGISRADVWRKTAHLVLADETIDSLGAGLESGGPLLIAGEPGNGKSAIASSLARMFRAGVLVPHAVQIDGHIVRVFDPSIHKPLQLDPTVSGSKMDERWVYCQAPFVRAGIELRTDDLSLRFNQQYRYYDCPIQLKAAGGVLLLDDLGSASEQVDDLLYRCLEPVATGVDYLTTVTGRALPVPFTPLLVVACARAPSDLLSEALLRRFPCKVHIPGPTEEQYRELFRRSCKDAGVECDPAGIDYVIERCYARAGYVPRSSHPAQLVQLICAASRYFGISAQIVPQLIDVAADMYCGRVEISGQ
ncbi:MAG: ATP-binding protein [Ktedonobacterales bacterium]